MISKRIKETRMSNDGKTKIPQEKEEMRNAVENEEQNICKITVGNVL